MGKKWDLNWKKFKKKKGKTIWLNVTIINTFNVLKSIKRLYWYVYIIVIDISFEILKTVQEKRHDNNRTRKICN
jgi:hypothetical protein